MPQPCEAKAEPQDEDLLLADVFEEEFIASALQIGVYGCVLRTALPTELVKAIRTTHAGELWAPRKLLTQLMNAWEVSLSAMWGSLTDWEQEVIIWAVQGMTNKEIATQLGISAKTVKTHLQNAVRKLNVRRRGHLLRFRLTSLPPPGGPRLNVTVLRTTCSRFPVSVLYTLGRFCKNTPNGRLSPSMGWYIFSLLLILDDIIGNGRMFYRL